MAQTYPLDHVIRKVDARTLPKDPAERRVIIDERTKGAVPNARFFAPAHYYIVSNASNPANVVQTDVPAIQLSDLHDTLEVEATLQVSCPPGNEVQVAEALYDPAYAPGVVLEAIVERCVREAARDGVGAFARRYYADPADVRQSLAAWIERATGLVVQMLLTLRADPRIVPVRVEVPHLAVLASDWDRELDLGFRADLEVEPAARADAVLTHARVLELHQIVPAELRSFVRQQVPLGRFRELGAGPLKQALAEHLNRALRPFGRRVGALVVDPGKVGEPDPEKRSVLVRLEVPCEVREYLNRVPIRNEVHIRVVDEVKYVSTGSRDLETWVRATLTRLVPELLFDARYTDLLLRFHVWEKKIKAGVHAAAEGIGCEIEQFVTVPTLPELIYLEPFLVRASGTFETRLHDVEARLEIVATVRIPELKDVAALLSTRPDIPRAMAQAIEDAVQKHMHSIHPERFYMRFSSTDEEHHGDEGQSVQEELTQLVTKRLTDDPFHAQVLNVVLKIVETELIRRFRELQEATPSFAVAVEPIGTEPMEFRGDLRVVGVHPRGWHTFRVLTGGIEQITARISDQLLTFLHTRPMEELLYRDEAGRAALHAEVSGVVARYAAEQFGLVVRVSNFRRTLTALELMYRNDILAAQTARVHELGETRRLSGHADLADQRGLLAAIERLVERRNGYLGTEDVDELRAIEEEIASLRRRLREARQQGADEVRAALTDAAPPRLQIGAGAPAALEGGEAAGVPAGEP